MQDKRRVSRKDAENAEKRKKRFLTQSPAKRGKATKYAEERKEREKARNEIHR